MRRRIKAEYEKSEAEGRCSHYWVIETPEGSTSKGVCKLCGAMKEFVNLLPEHWLGDFTDTKPVGELDKSLLAFSGRGGE